MHTARSNNNKTSYGYAAAPRVSTMSFSALGNTFVKSDVNRLMSGSAFRIFLDTKALSTNLELVLDDYRWIGCRQLGQSLSRKRKDGSLTLRRNNSNFKAILSG